jgi:hypothetical protein
MQEFVLAYQLCPPQTQMAPCNPGHSYCTLMCVYTCEFRAQFRIKLAHLFIKFFFK